VAPCGRWLLVAVLSLSVVDAAAQGDAGKRDDAGANWQSAIRVVPVKDERVPNGRMAAWQGTLGANDTVDVFRTPTLGRDQFISILVVPGPGVTASYSVKVTDREGGTVFIERNQISGKQSLDVEVTGEVAVRLETAATTAFEYGVALLVAPPPRPALMDLEVKNPRRKPPEGFTFLVPATKDRAAEASKTAAAGAPLSTPAPATNALPATSPSRSWWMVGGAGLILIVGGAGYLLGRRRR